MRVFLWSLYLVLPAIGMAGWPEFRGPHRSGTAADADLPEHFGPGSNVVWSAQIPSGHSSPVVVNDRLFITAFAEEKLLTLAFDARNGTELWRRGVEPGSIEAGSRLSHPATATPSTDGERVITYFAPFGVIAHDFQGAELWRHRLPTPVTLHGASSSPTIAGDLVLQLCDQDATSFLLALDRRTGEVRWKADRPGIRRGFTTPLPWPAEKPTLAVVAGTLRLAAYRLSDGGEQWTVSGLPNEMVASPVGDSDSVYVAGWTYGSGVRSMPAWEDVIGSGDKNQDGVLSRAEAPAGPVRQHFHYIDSDMNGTVTREEYRIIAEIFDNSKNVVMAVRPEGSGDVTDTHVRWRQTRGLPYVPSPLLYGGHLYLVKNGGLASCLDPEKGEFLYQEERLGALGDYYSSPIAGGGKILAISQAGVAVVYRAGPALEVIARNPLDEQVLATPALVGNTLYVRTETRLYAFRNGATSVAPAAEDGHAR